MTKSKDSTEKLKEELRDCTAKDFSFGDVVIAKEGSNIIVVRSYAKCNSLFAIIGPTPDTANHNDHKREREFFVETPDTKIHRGNNKQRNFVRSPQLPAQNPLEYQIDFLKKLQYHPNIISPLVTFTGSFPTTIDSKLAPSANNALFTFIIVENYSETLQKHISVFKELKEPQMRKFCISIGKALLALEEKHIVHLNLNLESFLRPISGTEVELSQFGYAKQLDDAFSCYLDENEPIGGNLNHIAPEILWREGSGNVDFSKQLNFAFGVLIHEIIYKELPFVDELYKYTKTTAPSRKIIRQEGGCTVSREFITIMSGLLRIDPTKRITIQEAIIELEKMYGPIKERYYHVIEEQDPEALCDLALEFQNDREFPKDIQKALELYNIAIECKSAKAMHQLGLLYKSGIDLIRDSKEAFRLFNSAAELDYVPAIYQLALLYDAGLGVDKDELMAVKLFHNAAELGSAAAMFNLGSLYQEGRVVPQDYKQGFQFFLKAAKLGHSDSQYNTAYCYQNAEGVERNMEQAIHYYQLAVDNSRDPEASHNLGDIYCSGRGGIPINYEFALKHFGDAAKFKKPTSCHCLGRMYKLGKGTNIQYQKAFELFKCAGDQNHSDSVLELACLYKEGLGVPKCPVKEAECYRKAADLGNMIGMYNLSLCYHRGSGVPNPALEIEYLIKAADLGAPAAVYNLAICYDNGEGVAMDKATACEYYVKAAHLKHLDAQYNAAICYELGQGVPVNLKKALEFFQMAANNGDTEAQQKISQYKTIKRFRC